MWALATCRVGAASPPLRRGVWWRAEGLRDESLDDAAVLEEPDVIAAEIIEDLQTALDEMSLIYADLAPAE